MKNIIRKLLLVLLSFLMIFQITSCTDEGKNDSTGTGETVTQTEAAADSDTSAIVKNGVAMYSVVYASDSSEDIRLMTENLVGRIEKKTGVTLEIKTDAEEIAAGGLILIGATKYSESAEVLSSLGEKEWSVIALGNRIVFAAHTDALITEAINYYVKYLLSGNVEINDDGTKSLYFEGYTQREASMIINGKSIESYKIIYASEPEGLDVAAKALQTAIYEKYGCNLSVGKDTSTQQGDCEILIGNTNRSEGDKYYSGNNVPLMYYKMVVDESRVVLICQGAFSALQAVTDFQIRYISDGQTEINADSTIEKNLLRLDDQPLTADSTMRVMTSNILADRWATGSRAPVAQRAEMYAAMLAVYHPDLIGVQETDGPWGEVLPYFLGILSDVYNLDYEWILNTAEGVPNLTSIIYRSDKYRLVESDVQKFSYNNETIYRLRVLSWAVFEEINDGTKYALVNTHWSGKEEDSKIEIPTEVSLLESIRSKYSGCVVFCTGDFNTHVNNAFEPFKTASGLIDSKEAAKANGTLINELPGIPEGIYIDHIFIYEGTATLTRYETINVNYAVLMSDHLPQYGDYKVIK